MILSPERRKSLAAKAAGLHDNLANVVAVQSYLDTRGISSVVAEMFQLGATEDGSRLSIPYLTRNGVVQIKYRCTAGHDHKSPDVSCTKYYGEAGCGYHLYNAPALIGAGELVVVTEGELDSVMVHAYTGIPAVAYPGVKNWNPNWRYCFEGVDEVVVVADGDDVGRNAALQIAKKIGQAARVVDLGDGDDASAYIQREGAQNFLGRITQ